MPEGSALRRGLAVLSVVAAEGECTAAIVAEAANMPLSTTYRYLAELTALGFIDTSGPRVLPGPALRAFQHRSAIQSRIGDVAGEVAAGITEATGDSVTAMVRESTHASILVRTQQEGTSRHSYDAREVLPLHAGAGQRVLLAWAPTAVQRAVFAGPMIAFTPATPDVERLATLIAGTRQAGFTVSREEVEQGAVSVAVPVHLDGEVVAALDVSSSVFRANRAWIDRSIREIDRAAQAIADDLAQWLRSHSDASSRVRAARAIVTADGQL